MYMSSCSSAGSACEQQCGWQTEAAGACGMTICWTTISFALCAPPVSPRRLRARPPSEPSMSSLAAGTGGRFYRQTWSLLASVQAAGQQTRGRRTARGRHELMCAPG